MSLSEFEYEPVPGLPGTLPAGETLLWQGSPQWWSLAKQALRVRIAASYFLALLLWQMASAWRSSHTAAAVLHATILPSALGAAALGVLGLIAWAAARATVYSLTDRRLVIRHGIALPMSLNVPFAQVQSAALRLCRDGSGELALTLPKKQRVGYLLNWPHVRPGHYIQPQPTLRGLADPAQVAQLVSNALRARSDAGAARAERAETRPAGEPVRVAMGTSRASAAA